MAAAVISVVEDAAAVAREAARRFADAAEEAIAARGRFCVALAGGSTPRATYERLGTPRDAGGYRDGLDWARVHVFWGDERPVPPDHPDSNYGMARAALLDAVPVPARQVHRMEAESPDPQVAAWRYEALLRACVPPGPGGIPALDLVLLGLGSDGHTASLFPGSPALGERERLVVPAWAEAAGTPRLTLTLPVLEATRSVLFVVSGAAKAEAVARVLRQRVGGAGEMLPAALVNTRAHHVHWVVDRAAAH